MIEISASKVVEVVFLAREGHRGEAELAGFLDGFNEDERASIVALAWVGRGAFEPEEFDTAVQTARAQATAPFVAYLTGMSDLAENLEAGMEAMGIDVTGEEEDLL